MIYLKEKNPFLNYNKLENGGSFIVYAKNEEIYTGSIWPAYSCSMPVGPFSPFIYYPLIYREYIIAIDYFQICDSPGNCPPDPRCDERIINALKEYHLYHVGLKCSIESINILEHNQVLAKISITNDDSFNYYILCPYNGNWVISLFYKWINVQGFQDKGKNAQM